MLTAGERILVVDDVADTLEILERMLRSAGYEVATAPGVRRAVELLEERPVDLVVTDLKMPEIGGLDLVRHVVANHPDTAVLMVTGYPSLGGAVEAVKAGAQDFLAKPFTDEELLRAVAVALGTLAGRRAAAQAAPADALGLIGECAAMREVRRLVVRAAASRQPVLVQGEGGTGKECVARAIHYAGARADGPFVTASLAAIPRERVEAEVLDSSSALVFAARQGTLYLEDVELAPAGLQQSLVGLIEDSRPESPRLIASTRVERSVLGRRETFRRDVLERLETFAISMPPLRARGDDVLLLVRHFARRAGAGGLPRLTDRAIATLRAYAWPGNVRELESVVRRLLEVGGGELDVPELPAHLRFSALGAEPLRSLEAVEFEHVRKVLAACDGNRSKAAEILGIDRKTLREKLKRLVPDVADDD